MNKKIDKVFTSILREGKPFYLQDTQDLKTQYKILNAFMLKEGHGKNEKQGDAWNVLKDIIMQHFVDNSDETVDSLEYEDGDLDL